MGVELREDSGSRLIDMIAQNLCYVRELGWYGMMYRILVDTQVHTMMICSSYHLTLVQILYLTHTSSHRMFHGAV